MRAEFFAIYPDYELCRTSAHNVMTGVTTRQKMRELMWKRAEGSKLNHDAIQERLDSKKIVVGDRIQTLKEMSLQQIIDLPDAAFSEVFRFYLKHPVAHSRLGRSRLLPRMVRTLFLRELAGQAMIRRLDLDIAAMFEMMELL
ncbi:MAG: hypothetical protein HY315_03605 [Acidobacteria bacterium]|nr:hypothetical protein [Acidobacteriota bacterium]